MPPKRDPKYCSICVEQNIDPPKQARNGGVCAAHSSDKKFCVKCVEENINPPSLATKKDSLCKNHYKKVETTCYICEALYIIPPNKGFESICESHEDYVGLCIRCIQFDVPEPKEVKGVKVMCDNHKNTRIPCKQCVALGCEPIHRVRDINGLCEPHGAPKYYCTACKEKGIEKSSYMKGLCKQCLKGDEITLCKTEGCENVKRSEGYCRSCYDKNSGIIKKCDTEGCDKYAPRNKLLCEECYYINMFETMEYKEKTEYKDGSKLCCVKECIALSRFEDFCHRHSDQNYKMRTCIRQRIYENNKYRTDPNYKIAKNLRRRLVEFVNNGFATKSESAIIRIGCTLDELKIHLSNKFKDGMTWENYGQWHIDHIIPCAAFDLHSEEQQKKCFHYSNLQPLWARDNIVKGSKV
jgi:hypothetical protein